MTKGAGPRHTAGTIEKTAGMEAVKAIDPQEGAIQTVRPALRMATAIRGMTAEDREGVRPGLKAMTVRAVMIARAGMTAGAVTTVRTGKAVRIGRVSQTVQTVQIALTARTGLIDPSGPISKAVKAATTVRTDRAGRTERGVEALLTTALATSVLASLLPRAATNPKHTGPRHG